MAKKYDWGDGNGAIHSLPLGRHLQNVNYGNPNAPDLGQLAQGAGFGPPKGLPQAGPGAQPAAAAAGGGGGATPLVPDAQYLAEAALRAKGRQDALDSYTLQSTQDSKSRDEAIRRLLDSVPDDTRALNTSANKQGLFYSSALTKNLSDYQKNLERSQGDVRTDFQNREDARVLARKAIESGAPLEEAAAIAASAGRSVATDAAGAANNSLVANATAAVAAAPATAAPKYTTQPGSGGAWHVYGDGRRVWVPRKR